jgi:hypothetical protein
VQNTITVVNNIYDFGISNLYTVGLCRAMSTNQSLFDFPDKREMLATSRTVFPLHPRALGNECYAI